jgi:hypothetical protein
MATIPAAEKNDNRGRGKRQATKIVKVKFHDTIVKVQVQDSMRELERRFGRGEYQLQEAQRQWLDASASQRCCSYPSSLSEGRASW